VVQVPQEDGVLIAATAAGCNDSQEKCVHSDVAKSGGGGGGGGGLLAQPQAGHALLGQLGADVQPLAETARPALF